MKQLLFAIITVLTFSGCGKHMYSTMSSGKENQSFIIVLRQDQTYPSGVTVIVDNNEYPVDKVFKMKFQRKARPVVITPGKHSIKVLFDGKELYKDEIFIGLQETKKIVLP